ncbi:MAG: hypothetical protein K8R76_05710 [Candidatus Aegiribacteria sp.]|nr:hypothetical protein [Candidatus Aegiribacteria sp.]
MWMSDFDVIVFNEHLGDNIGDINTPFPFRGDLSSEKTFFIPYEPRGSGYLTMQVYDVQYQNHKVFLNNSSFLCGYGTHEFMNKTGRNRWRVTMQKLNHTSLKMGDNTIQIQRASGSDNILIGTIVVNWRSKCPWGP